MSVKKTLLQINVTANWGSTGKIAEQIGLKAVEAGWESYIAYGRMKNLSSSRLVKVGTNKDVYMHFALGHFLDDEGLGSKNATINLIQSIEQISPSVVHLHNIHDHWLNYQILFNYLEKKDVPVVWTQHDLWAVTGGCCYIPDDCVKWKTRCHDCILRKGPLLDKSLRNYELKKELFSSLNSLTLVPVSDWLGGMLKNSFLGDTRIEVIKNGIDTNVFKPRDTKIKKKYGVEGKKIVLGVASEWSERKGLKDFILIADSLSKEEYVIIIVGKILGKHPNSTRRGCEIIYIDRTQNIQELSELYSVADVFVNPTYQDNYPTTNLEAMACGTPVITYNTGGSPEALDEETGFVVAQGNIEKVVDAIKVILSHGKQYYSAACRKRASEYFDKDKCFVKYIRLYERLIREL